MTERHQQPRRLAEPELEADESRLRGLYRQLADEQPPAALDERILEAAREAARGSREQPSGAAPFSTNWYHFASLAAVLVMCVGVVSLLVDEAGRPLLDRGDRFSEEMLRIEKQPGSRESRGAMRGAPPQRPAQKTLESPTAEALAAPKANAPGAARPDMPAEKAEAPAPAAMLQGSVKRPLGSTSGALPRSPAGEDQTPRRQAADATTASAAAALDKDQTEAGAAAPGRRDPQTWLRQIRDLRDAGRWREADESLAAFRKAYPDYPEERIEAALKSG